MTFKTFEELDTEAGPSGLFMDYAQKPADPALAGYDTPETIIKAKESAKRSTFAAAFRQDNTIGSLLSRQDTGVDNHDDGQFDPVAYIRDNKLEGYEDSFMGVLNGRRADAVKSQIEMEKRDRETLDASGWVGTLAQIAAGVFDAPTLIPGVVAVRGAAGGWSVGRSILMAGASAAATQAATEGFLQATQETRNGAESLVNIGAAAVLGSLLGGGVAAVLGKNERIAVTKALENIADIQSGVKPNEFVPAQVLADRSPAGAGADVADGAFYVDPIQKARTREELAVEGTAAGFVAEKTAWFNPVLRATQRYAASARQVGNVLYENTIYRALHSSGDTTGVSVEAAIRTRVTALQAEAGSAAQASFKEMRAGGTRMTEDDFYSAVGRAMRNNDEDENPFVARAAQGYRKLFDEFTKDALKLGLLDEGDLDVKTAASYFSRVYNRDKLLAAEPDFLDTIGRHFADLMSKAYETEAADVSRARAKYKQRVEDINLSGPERALRIDQIEAEYKALDAKNAGLNDLVHDLTEARGALRDAVDDAAKTAARAEVKRLMDKGGNDLKNYLTERANLRARMRNLTERNSDAQASRYEKISQRIDEAQETAKRAVVASGKRLRNIMNKLATDPVGQAESALGDALKEADRIQKALVASDRRLAALEKASQGGDQPEALVTFWQQRRAEQEAARATAQTLIDELEKLSVRGINAEELRAALSSAPGKSVEQQAAGAAKRKGQREGKLLEQGNKITQNEFDVIDAERLVGALNKLLDDVASQAGERSIRRGEAVGRLKERAAKLTPDEVKARAEAQNNQFARVLEAVENRFDGKWGPRRALGIERGEAFDFEAAGRSAAKEIYDKITGKVQQRDDLPTFITKITSGPLKDRTFMVPDELLQGKDWLKDDVREVANRYSRAMAGEIELTRRFGKADMSGQLAQIAQEYSDLRVAADKATTIDELNRVLGRDKYGKRADLTKAKLDAQKVLAADESSAVTDTKAGRDLIRGTYNQAVNNSNFGSLSRILMHFNYLRQMGGVLLSNITEFYKPAMVHGLGPYLNTLPQAMAQAFDAGSDGFKLALKEAKLAGLVSERVTNALMAANGDIADPFLSRTTQIERFMQKATGLASRWNLINLFTDAQQTIASSMSQHRVLEAVIGNGGKDGSFVNGDGTRLLRLLGIDERTQGDIARLFGKFGETVDEIRVANTERWLQEGGTPEQIARNENAVRTYRAAINTDVNSIVSRRGIGDAPLFANHPFGKVLTQFSGYAMGAHSRVMIRGLQEGHARLVGGLVVMTALGALTSYLAAFRGGKERFDKYVADTTKTPGVLIGEGLDRSGFFPLLFDAAGRVEKASTSVGYNYRFNPIKSPISKATGGNFFADTPSTRSSEGAGLLSAVGGPSVGLLESVPAAGRVLASKAEGKTPTKRDVNQAQAIIPFQSYYGMREILQVLNGNSSYVRN